jgi:hypothetical protein
MTYGWAEIMGLTISADCGTAILESAGPVATCVAKCKKSWHTSDKIAVAAVVISVLTLAVGLGCAYATFQT